MILMLYNS